MKKNKFIEEVYKKYSQIVFQFAFKHLKDEALANDVVQETFYALCQKENLANILNLNAFIFQIAHNKVIDVLRDHSRNQNLKNRLWKNINNLKLEIESNLVDQEYNSLLQDAISKLSIKQQEIFRLVRFEGLSHQMVADKLRISKNTVKNHMVTALRQIKNYIQLESDITLLLCIIYFL